MRSSAVRISSKCKQTALKDRRRGDQTGSAARSATNDDGEIESSADLPNPADDRDNDQHPVRDKSSNEEIVHRAAGVPKIIQGDEIEIGFNVGRCIHSRFCVLRQPHVYRANVEGEWIDPNAETPAELIALARDCPSGAITYRSRGDEAEPAPPVNTISPRENGPLSFRGDLHLYGILIERRATLCRCGASANKPFCDGSHLDIGFEASGEAPRRQNEGLVARDGPVDIVPQLNGPLRIDGNVDIVSGTQRPITRTHQVRLCRCGASDAKPFCDGSHARIGFISDTWNLSHNGRTMPTRPREQSSVQPEFLDRKDDDGSANAPKPKLRGK